MQNYTTVKKRMHRGYHIMLLPDSINSCRGLAGKRERVENPVVTLFWITKKIGDGYYTKSSKYTNKRITELSKCLVM